MHLIFFLVHTSWGNLSIFLLLHVSEIRLRDYGLHHVLFFIHYQKYETGGCIPRVLGAPCGVLIRIIITLLMCQNTKHKKK